MSAGTRYTGHFADVWRNEEMYRMCRCISLVLHPFNFLLCFFYCEFQFRSYHSATHLAIVTEGEEELSFVPVASPSMRENRIAPAIRHQIDRHRSSAQTHIESSLKNPGTLPRFSTAQGPVMLKAKPMYTLPSPKWLHYH